MGDDKVLDMGMWSEFLESLVCLDVKPPKRQKSRSFYIVLLDDPDIEFSMFNQEHWDYAFKVQRMIEGKKKR